MARHEEMKMTDEHKGTVLLIPNMEPYCVKIMASVFSSIGYNPIILEESDETLALGFKHTAGGECVPCPITTGAIIKVINDHDYDPAKVTLFMPTACGPCRFGQYAKLNSIIFEQKGWDKIKILSPSAENAYEGIPTKARKRLWHALILGDIFRKLACKIRPYEIKKGQTDEVVERHMDKMADLFKGEDISAVDKYLAEAVKEISEIQVRQEKRPLIGVVGEIYVRSDPYINGDLIRRIEDLGGEVWLTPFSEWIFYTIQIRHLVAKQRGNTPSAMIEKAMAWMENNFFFEKWEHHYYEIAKPILHDRTEWPIEEVMEAGEKYMPWQFEGESILTVGRAEIFVKKDGCKAIVNASPMFCMPGTVTTSIFPVLEKDLSVPIICNFYDGSGDPNKSLAPVMHYLAEEAVAAGV